MQRPAHLVFVRGPLHMPIPNMPAYDSDRRVGHWLHPQSMADLAAFINEKLPYDISYDIDDEEYAE